VEAVRNKVALVAEHVERANEDWGRLRSELPAGAAEDLSGKIDIMESRLESCRRSLAAFDLGSAVAPPPGDPAAEPIHPAELKV
jgi:hypothetical protein